MAAYRQGIQFENQHNSAKAVEAFARAAQLGENALGPTSPVLADIYNALGHNNFSLGRYSDASASLQRTLAIRQRALPPNDPKLANSFNDLAFVDAEAGQYDEAMKLYQQAESIQERIHGPDHPETVRVLNNLAVLDLYLARYAEAEALLQRVTASWEKALGPTNPDVLTSYNNLAGLYDLQDRYSEAEPLIRHVLEIREKTFGANNPAVAQSLNNLARLYMEEGRYADAEPLARRALQIAETVHGPDHPDVVTELSILSIGYDEQRRYAEAEPLLKRALAIREKAFGASNINVAQILNNMAGLETEQRHYSDAEPLLKRAIEIKEKALGPDHPDLAADLHNLGSVLTQENRLAEAGPLLTRALAIQEKSLGPNHRDIAGTLNSIAGLYDAQGRSRDALEASRKAVAILVGHNTQTGDELYGQSERERQSRRADYVRLVHLLAASADHDSLETVDEAFHAAQYAGDTETAKAVSGTMARYASGAGELATLVREREDLSKRWKKLDTDLIKAASLAPDKRNPASEAALRKEEADVEAKLKNDNERLDKTFPRFAELAQARPVSVADVQASLGIDEAYVAFTLAENESFLFVVRKQEAHFFKLDITRLQAAETVKLLRAGLANDAPVDVTKAYQLYQSLLGPANSLIADAKNLIISPDGALESLPFAVLVTEPPATISKPSDYQSVAWLIRRQAISVAPSASSMVASRRFAQEGQGRDPFAGFGDPIFDGSGDDKRGIDMASLYRGAEASNADLRRLPRLPETADELRAEARILGASESSLHLGRDASIATLRRLDLSSIRILSFATHGLIAGDLPKLGEPALVLTPPARPTAADDGLLRASEVSTLKLNADFIILSACNTAASDGSPGAEGLSGLAKAFFYAGARSLLVSHWPVASVATVRLTTGLVSAAAREPAIGRAEALRRSILAMIDDPANKAELAHPFFWAPFVLAGEGGANR